MLRNRIVGVVVGIATLLTLADGMAQQARVTVTPETAVQATQSLILPLNKSQVLRVNQAVSRITGTQQVMLQVKVAEMSRHISKALGFKPFVSPSNGNIKSTGFTLSTLDPVDVTRFALAMGQVVSGNFVFRLALDALEEKGAVKILAEPNLVAMSGDTASFLAGGEFAIPVAQNIGIGGVPNITIEFKPFGVSLAFTPTVIDGDLINLVVAPEVSQLAL